MILAAHQLHYLPWLRYFHKIALCDTFVVLDNIQFNKNGWQNRNKIKTPKGWGYLSVPVLHKNEQLLNEVRIDNHQPWPRKHWGSLSGSYSKAPFFKEHADFLKKIYETPWERLNDLNYEMFFYFLKALGIKAKIVKSSEMNLRGEATDRLIGICKDLGAKAYLTGAYAAEVYLDSEDFKREGIELVFQKFDCPGYPQLYPEAGFVPELAIVDLLLNCGPKSFETLMSTTGCGASGDEK
jgi:hypothetical protein